MEVEAGAATKTYETQTFAMTTMYSGAYLCHPSLHLLSKLGFCEEMVSHTFWGHSNTCCDSFYLPSHNTGNKKKKNQTDKPAKAGSS